ncbi:hypothetical protein [Paenibacillus sp. L3-i20]|uniref:hypothetical protein n=1 Tax=Paenibacillus sp. L3-i20 TaxID=2905833 RepID=UPI001EDE1F95|nr:hypothetical protein [Paenibacillus sp. L3-i20]GKU79374.1 hypothetical protein L3i20_v237710 [Paenibacillus sp. L3-i20]
MAQKKPIGYGSISLLLLLFGFLFNIPLQNDFKISYLLFNILNLDIYSNGDVGIHYPVVASIIFWIPALLIAKKYPNDYGASISYHFSSLLSFLIIFAVVMTTIFS